MKQTFWGYVLGSCLWMSAGDGLAEQQCDAKGRTMPNERFVIFGDNRFVRDRVTGLEWMRCAVGQVWSHEQQNCLESSKKQVQSWFNHDGALNAVARENDALVDAAPWRLPSITELSTLVDRGCRAPAINLDIFPNAPSWRFWSASPMEGNADYIWVIDYETGEAKTLLKTINSHYMRLVRGQPMLLTKNKKASLEHDLAEHAPWDDGIHDIENPDVDKLQIYQDILSVFPRDSSGNPDWVKALNRGLVSPRASKQEGDESPMFVWKQDILFKETLTMPWVKFPHEAHTQWLDCGNCHEDMFSSDVNKKADISMASIYMGEHCGRCHGKVAFDINTCWRCHSVLHEGVSENGRKMLDIEPKEQE